MLDTSKRRKTLLLIFLVKCFYYHATDPFDIRISPFYSVIFLKSQINNKIAAKAEVAQPSQPLPSVRFCCYRLQVGSSWRKESSPSFPLVHRRRSAIVTTAKKVLIAYHHIFNFQQSAKQIYIGQFVQNIMLPGYFMQLKCMSAKKKN